MALIAETHAVIALVLTKKTNIMKLSNVLFGLLFLGLAILILSILKKDIVLLGVAELICITSEIALIISLRASK